jgi:hypothetical protein
MRLNTHQFDVMGHICIYMLMFQKLATYLILLCDPRFMTQNAGGGGGGGLT